MKKIKVSIGLAIFCLSIPFVASAAYQYPDGGALLFDGGQNPYGVWSKIKDNKNPFEKLDNDDGKNYAVEAIVKVGNKTHSSGWKIAEAVIRADRNWYTNETSHYDYTRINTTYSHDNWGTDY